MRVNIEAIKGISMIFIGCCLNVIFFELIIKNDPGAGNVVTLAQFAFVSLIGFFGQIEVKELDGNNGYIIKMRKRVLSVKSYLIYDLLFFSVSVINNKALAYNIAMPIHMIIRSGSLVVSLVLGYFFLGKRYTATQVLSVLSVTLGIFLATTASVSLFNDMSIGDDVRVFLTGILMLVGALVFSAVMGLCQEYTYSNSKSGCPKEQLVSEHKFYSHLLSLPLFICTLPDVIRHVKLWNTIDVIDVNLFGTSLHFSSMWLYILGNVITQYICISGVFKTAATSGALTMTLAISLRKFVSLLLSIWMFKNPFTTQHWIATALIFGGTLVYSWPGKENKKPQPKAKKD